MEDKQIKGGHGHHEKNEKDPDTVSLCDTCNRSKAGTDVQMAKKGTLKMESISQAAISLENMSICLIAMVSNSRKTQLTKAFGTL